MPYLLDGHNLIPRMGLRLDAFDDELALIGHLNQFCRLARRGHVEVYFDQGQPGLPETRKMGSVTARFIRSPLSADGAIRLRLKKLGKSARNWSVVSSDREVQSSARSAGATVISSDEFARTVIETLRGGQTTSGNETGPGEAEVQEWLRLFKDRDRKFGQF